MNGRNEEPRTRSSHRSGALLSIPIAMDLNVMKLHHKAKLCQLPDLFDWVVEQDRRVADHRVRWVARRCRVPFATAEAIIANAGFSDGERRR